MPKRSLPRIAEVSAGDVHFGLIITWQDGSVSAVDVAEPINTFRLYAPLRHDPALFRSVQTGEFGTDIVWTDGIDMSADTLWRLAREQAGTAMSAEQFRQWRSRQGISLTEAAAALGLSRRMVSYYESGAKPIPRVVALATQAIGLQPGRKPRQAA